MQDSFFAALKHSEISECNKLIFRVFVKVRGSITHVPPTYTPYINRLQETPTATTVLCVSNLVLVSECQRARVISFSHIIRWKLQSWSMLCPQLRRWPSTCFRNLIRHIHKTPPDRSLYIASKISWGSWNLNSVVPGRKKDCISSIPTSFN